ncbi:MAG: Ig-like domain-containing protein [Patescibacteria group bacterium]
MRPIITGVLLLAVSFATAAFVFPSEVHALPNDILYTNHQDSITPKGIILDGSFIWVISHTQDGYPSIGNGLFKLNKSDLSIALSVVNPEPTVMDQDIVIAGGYVWWIKGHIIYRLDAAGNIIHTYNYQNLNPILEEFYNCDSFGKAVSDGTYLYVANAVTAGSGICKIRITDGVVMDWFPVGEQYDTILDIFYLNGNLYFYRKITGDIVEMNPSTGAFLRHQSAGGLSTAPTETGDFIGTSPDFINRLTGSTFTVDHTYSALAHDFSFSLAAPGSGKHILFAGNKINYISEPPNGLDEISTPDYTLLNAETVYDGVLDGNILYTISGPAIARYDLTAFLGIPVTGPATDEIPSLGVMITSDPTATVAGNTANFAWQTAPNPGTSWGSYRDSDPISMTSMNITTETLRDIDCQGTRCFAVGHNGVIHRSTNVTTWSAQTSGTSNDLFSVSAVSPDIAWAVGEAGTILRTANGGSTWTAQTSPYGTVAHINSVFAIDSNTAWAVTSTGKVIRTTDGYAWSEAASLATNVPMNAIMFAKNSDGTLSGCVAGDAGNLWRYDSGTTFTKLTTNDTSSGLEGCSVSTQPGSHTAFQMFGVARNGKVWRHDYSGTGTTSLTNPLFSGLAHKSVQMYPGGRVWIGDSNGKALYSDDAGLSWTLINLGASTTGFLGLYVYEPTDVVFVGTNGGNFRYQAIYGTTFGPSTYLNSHNIPTPALAELTTYHYKVASQTAAGAYVGSWDYTFDTGFDDTTPPTWPTPNVNGTKACSGSTIQYTLTWDQATDAESGIDHYEVWRSVNSSLPTSYSKVNGNIAATGPYTLTDPGPLNPGSTYRYIVRAYNRAELYTESPVHSIVPGTPTFNITWEGPQPLPPHVTVTKGDPGVYQINVTRDWCFAGTIAWSYVSSTPPTGQPAMAGTMYTFGPETSGIVQMNVATSALGLGTYTNMKVKGVSGTTKYVDLAKLTIESTDTTPPSAPTVDGELQCSGTTGRTIVLNWSEAVDLETGISKYEVYRCTGASCTFPTTPLTTLTGSPPPTTYTDATVSPNLTYKYKVIAYNGGVPPMPITSNIFTKSTTTADCDNDISAPTAPVLTVTAECSLGNLHNVSLSWTPAVDNESNIVRYEIFRNGTLIATVGGGTTSYPDLGLAPGTYSYVIDAWNDATPALKVSSQAKSITLDAAGLSVNVIAPATKSITVASGNPAVYTVQVTPQGCFADVATLSLGTVPAPISTSNTTFNPSTLALSGGAPKSALMTIDTTGFLSGTYQPININANSPTANASVPQSPNPVTLIIDSSVCTDGTPNLTCVEERTGNESDLPVFCDTSQTPELFDNCGDASGPICGCPVWTATPATDKPYCNITTGSCELKCSDGTDHLTCSTVTPGSYCDLTESFDPVENCNECDAPGDGYCDAANEMCDADTGLCEIDDIPPALTCPVTCVGGTDYITVSWCTDEDATSLVNYGLASGFLPGSKGDTAYVKNHTVNITGLLPDAEYYYRALSKDIFGNLFTSPEMTCSTASIPDGEPPSCDITDPLNGATVSNTIPFSAIASDNIGVVGVDFTAASVFQTTVTTPPYTMSLNTKALPDGTVQLSIKARDGASPVPNTCEKDILVTVNNDAAGPQLVGDIDYEFFNSGRNVRIRWTTDEASSGELRYGEQGKQNTWTESVPYSLATSHEIELGPFPFGFPVGFAIWACDALSNCNYLSPN